MQLSTPLQEAVLLHLTQHELQHNIALVCKELERVQREGQQLWRTYYLNLAAGAWELGGPGWRGGHGVERGACWNFQLSWWPASELWKYACWGDLIGWASISCRAQ